MKQHHETGEHRRAQHAEGAGDRAAALDVVLGVAAAIEDDTRRDLEERGLTRSRTHLVWALAHAGPSTQRALAEALGVSPRNVTGLVDALVATGFVTREAHPTDRRAALVTLTPRGAETADELRAGHAELADQLFGDVDPDRLRRLREDLERLLTRFRELEVAHRVGRGDGTSAR